jgi:hypothetical protein
MHLFCCLSSDADARDYRHDDQYSFIPPRPWDAQARTAQPENSPCTELVDDRALPQAGNLVLYVQFLAFQFQEMKVVGGGMGERFTDFLLKGLMPLLKFRKMRFDRHVLASLRRLLAVHIILHTPWTGQA